MPLKLSQAEFRNALARERVLPVVVIERAQDAGKLIDALWAGGCRMVEITLRSAAALDAIAAVALDRRVAVGAGTVLDGAQVRAAHAAGAKFIVSPGLDRAVVEATLSLQLPVVPGAATASELMEARALALNVVKIFPAEQLGGAAGVRALTSPFGAMSFMPTGGVNDTNLASYLAVPGVIACGSSWLAPSDLVMAGDFAEVTRRTADARRIAGAAQPTHI